MQLRNTSPLRLNNTQVPRPSRNPRRSVRTYTAYTRNHPSHLAGFAGRGGTCCHGFSTNHKSSTYGAGFRRCHFTAPRRNLPRYTALEDRAKANLWSSAVDFIRKKQRRTILKKMENLFGYQLGIESLLLTHTLTTNTFFLVF